MNRLKEMQGLSVQARWRLAAAYALAGKKDAALQLTNNASDQVEHYAFSNNTFGSSSAIWLPCGDIPVVRSDTKSAKTLI